MKMKFCFVVDMTSCAEPGYYIRYY